MAGAAALARDPAPTAPRNPIIEKLLGDTGEPDRVINAAESMASRALQPIMDELGPRLAFLPDIEVETVDLVRISEALPAAESFDTVVVAAGSASPDALTMIADCAAISILVQAAFGGERTVPPVAIERAPSALELQVAAVMFEALARALNGSGSRSLDIRFPLPEPQHAAETASAPARDGPAARLVFRLSIGEFGGRLTALVPQRVLIARRSEASNTPAAQWRARLNEEIMRSHVRLEAAIPLPRVSLAEVAGWRLGQVLEFPANAQADTRLSVKGKALFQCEFGRLGNNFTVRVRDPLDAAQDFIDGLRSR